MVKKEKNGIYIILSSPSGAGKTTIARKLVKKDKNLKLSISYTTRIKRSNEKDKKDYFFITKKEFNSLKKKGFFIEWAKVFNNYYGTSLSKTKKIFHSGKDILFDIDWQGSRKIKKKIGQNVINIFILPPTKKELIKRLNKRAQDPKDVVKQRLSFFKTELSHWKEYQYVLINDDLQKTTNNILSIINSERIKRSKLFYIKNIIKSLENK